MGLVQLFRPSSVIVWTRLKKKQDDNLTPQSLCRHINTDYGIGTAKPILLTTKKASYSGVIANNVLFDPKLNLKKINHVQSNKCLQQTHSYVFRTGPSSINGTRRSNIRCIGHPVSPMFHCYNILLNIKDLLPRTLCQLPSSKCRVSQKMCILTYYLTSPS